jgi:hypothetical protein
MIIEPTVVIINGENCDQLTHNTQYWACGGLVGSNVIDLFTIESRPLCANASCTVLSGTRWGFGATSYAELLSEIAIRGYEFPTITEE